MPLLDPEWPGGVECAGGSLRGSVPALEAWLTWPAGLTLVELVVLLPETASAGARIFADRILHKVSGHDFGDAARSIHVTISVGIACYPDERVQDGESLLKLADQNLYKAKVDGRNRYRE